MNEEIERFADHVHVDMRWDVGGIARFAENVLELVAGRGRRLHGRMERATPQGQLEMAARFAPLARRAGLLFSPGFAAPFVWERRTIVTVHDLHFLDPTISTARQRIYFGRVMVPQLRRCRLVLTVSDDSARQIRDVLGARAPRVVVVGNGVDESLLDVRGDRAGGPPRLLFVGGDKPNKNLGSAMRAFAAAAAGTDVELVVVGDVAARLRAQAGASVRFVGAVSDERLADLYGGSTALLMPSISEGFGLPALEAMVAGTPVIYGDRHALPDVVGGHGWPVDPYDVGSIAAGIEAALRDQLVIPDTQRRELAQRHRWTDVARRVSSAVAEVS